MLKQKASKQPQQKKQWLGAQTYKKNAFNEIQLHHSLSYVIFGELPNISRLTYLGFIILIFKMGINRCTNQSLKVAVRFNEIIQHLEQDLAPRKLSVNAITLNIN